ncbi:hypothetical protein [Bacillus solitudinis]|uniref:hypothetical protein n=1 Tax=Bacillus solitudinis TaxID=2014074 RepID=UPI000C23BD7E|nr:hypothetical protein [Bacillus solitudinis]
MSNNIDEIMGRLKKQYDDFPTTSSADNIMSKIKKEEKPKRMVFFRRHWQAVAMIIAAIGIGSVLTLNQLGQQGANDTSTSLSMEAGEADRKTMMVEPNEEQDQLSDDTATVREESEADNHSATVNKESETVKEFYNPSDSEISVSEAEQAETKTVLFSQEGIEEEITVKRVSDEYLGFSTYIDDRFETEVVEKGEAYVFQIFANFGQGKIDHPLLSITFTESNGIESVEDVADLVRGMYEDYVETEERVFTNHSHLGFMKEMTFTQGGDEYTYVGIVEREGRYVVMTFKVSGETREAFYNHLENIILPEFDWTQS